MSDITDRAKAPLEGIVRSALPTYDYRALYRARVVSQSADKKKVDVQPNDPDFPGVKAEIVLFGPKATVTVATGTNVLLTWEGADPTKPIALLFFAESGTKEVARKGDKVNLGTFNILGGVGNLMTGIQWIPAGGGTPVNFSVTAIPSPNELNGGKISEGSDTIKID